MFLDLLVVVSFFPLNSHDITGHHALHNPEVRGGQLSRSYALASFFTRGSTCCQIPGASSRWMMFHSM